jgi:hypothetical protein
VSYSVVFHTIIPVLSKHPHGVYFDYFFSGSAAPHALPQEEGAGSAAPHAEAGASFGSPAPQAEFSAAKDATLFKVSLMEKPPF